MRPERVRRFQAPFRVSGLDRAPRAANDNVPAIRKGLARRFLRWLLLGFVPAVLVFMVALLGSGDLTF